METVITLDLGPTFLGQTAQIDGETVCVLPPTALSEAQARACVRELMWGQGIDCRACRGCPVGTAS